MVRTRISIWHLLLPAFWLCCQVAFAQTPRLGTQLYIDGKNITDGMEFELERDDLVRFDAYRLQSASVLNIIGKKGAIRFYGQSFTSNARGEVKAVLFFPKASNTISCTVEYIAENGEPKEVRFVLHPAASSRKERRRSKTGIPDLGR